MANTDHKSEDGNVSLRERLYIILEAGKTSDIPSLIFDSVMVGLIIANVVAFALETVPSVYASHGTALELFNVISVLIFTVEYVARVWVCVEHPPYRGQPPLRARRKFLVSPYMIIDLLAILPFYLALFIAIDLRVLRVFRLIRFLKLARYSPALASLGGTFKAERRALIGAIIIMLGLLMLVSSVMYFIEREAQPDAFGSVPQAMWWGLATLTTVGYGDVVPITPLGRFVGGLVMIMGLAVFALPIGIIATGWSQEIHRREFVVTWGVVARVPLFAKLDAVSVAEVMTLLRARVADAGEIILRRGDPTKAMYFITSGEVNIRLRDRDVILGEGDFFGAVALLNHRASPIAVQALRKTHLLCLESDDFHGLLERDPALRQHLAQIAESRIKDGWGHADQDVEEPPQSF